MALQAIKLIFANLETSVTGTPGDAATAKAREKMHNAGTIAGMAFGNAFLGIVHAMAHTIGATFHLVHGRTNATLLPTVIRYNGTVPTKLNAWPKYENYVAPERLQEIAAMLGLPASTPAEGVESYARAVENLRDRVGIPRSFQAQGVDEADFIGRLDQLAMGSYRDQCAPANPRMPMLSDMKELMVACYYGESHADARSRLSRVGVAQHTPEAGPPALVGPPHNS
jgi:acetaldehyde dehydrogenase/alcohol dehydrogenase